MSRRHWGTTALTGWKPVLRDGVTAMATARFKAVKAAYNALIDREGMA